MKLELPAGVDVEIKAFGNKTHEPEQSVAVPR
jgi:hypothetical protein